MKHVVITGSTRGIGYGLADSFLAQGCSVTVSGRTQQAVNEAVESLTKKYSTSLVHGKACDVRQLAEVQALWDSAKLNVKNVDIWVNNAGYSGPQMKMWQIPPELTQAVVETNIVGSMYGARVAIEGMLKQGFGAIYNMEGAGSDGRVHAGMTVYATTKYGLKYFTDALVAETKDTPLIIGSIRPGMVITDMIMAQYKQKPEEFAKVKRIFNIIADKTETVCPWLAQRMLANTKSGERVVWLTRSKAMKRMLTAGFNKRDLFTE